MGDRCNIVVCERDVEGKTLGQALDEGKAVVFCGHWAGYEMPARLKQGLAAGKGRWGDDAYLNRIIFCHFVPAEQLHDETGYGIIAGGLGDNERPILLVDHERRWWSSTARATSARTMRRRSPPCASGPSTSSSR